MAIYRYFRNNDIPVILFAESSPGVFTHVIDSDESSRYDSSGTTMKVAAVGIDPSTIVRDWWGDTYCDEIETNFLECTSSYTSAMYPSYYYTGENGDITIRDDHGTHIGTQNCENAKCYYSSSYPGCVGVMHESSEHGWVFKGWKVKQESYSSGIEIASEGYERTYSDGAYYWQIPKPTDSDLQAALVVYGIYGTGRVITIEAIYEELPKFSISFDLNGGEGDAPSVDTYQGDSITIPDYRPVRDGYKFLGWASSPSATTAEYVSGDEITPDEDVILYAVWEESEEPDEPITPGGGGGGSTKGFIRRSSTSAYLIFSVATGNLVYN